MQLLKQYQFVNGEWKYFILPTKNEAPRDKSDGFPFPQNF